MDQKNVESRSVPDATRSLDVDASCSPQGFVYPYGMPISLVMPMPGSPYAPPKFKGKAVQLKTFLSLTMLLSNISFSHDSHTVGSNLQRKLLEPAQLSLSLPSTTSSQACFT